jgi:hypothetical protein
MKTLQKIKFLLDSLDRQSSWYTGLSIKRYIKEHVFSLQVDFHNRTLESGRWSAYTHLNQERAFSNLLSKHLINENSIIITHPLIPPSLFNTLQETGAHIETLEINKTTLSFDSNNLQDFIRQLRIKNQKPDLIIHYDSNGLYNDIAKSLEFSKELYIPSIVVIDNPIINSEFFNCLNALHLGGILWLSQESFIDEHIEEAMSGDLNNLDWYFSIHIEDRIRSIAENHLRESHDIFEQLIKDYLIILATKHKKDGIRGYLYWWLTKFNHIKKDETIDTITERLKDTYFSLPQSALPDILFDLEDRFPTQPESNPIDLLEHDLVFRTRAKMVYDFFAEVLEKKPDVKIEIPSFYLDRTYLKFVFYTTEKEYWQSIFEAQGISISTLTHTYNNLVNETNIPITKFVASYGLVIDLNTVYKKPTV